MLLKHKRNDSSWDTFLHYVTFWHICVKNTAFEMSLFYFELFSYCSLFHVSAALICCVLFPLHLRWNIYTVQLLTCHFGPNYCYIYSFFHSFFLTAIFFLCFFSCSLPLIFLSCPLLLLSPTLISVFFLLLPFVQCSRYTLYMCFSCLFHFIY